MDEKAEFSARLAAALLAAGYEARPSVLEKGFNTRYWGKPITFQAASRWLKGESIPAQDKLQVLAEWLQLEPQILRFGGESLFTVKQKRQRWDEAVTGPEREILEAFINLPAPQKKVAREVILALAKVAASAGGD